MKKQYTDENGIAKFNADLPLGKFYIKEITPSVGYIKDDSKFEIDSTTLSSDERYYNVFYKKQNTKTQVTIEKIEATEDFENRVQLNGTILQLLDGTNVIEEWTVDGPKTFKGLELNKEYTIHEVSYIDGYVTADDIKFTIDDYGNIITEDKYLLKNNTKEEDTEDSTQDEITENNDSTQDTSQDENIENNDNAQNENTENNDDTQDENSDNNTQDENTEDNAPNEGEQDIQINISQNGNTTTILMQDNITRLIVNVIDIETKEQIPGATVQIIDKETGEVVKEFVTEDVPTVLEKLPVGDYEIHVTEVPKDKGYVTPEVMDFSIKDSPEDQEVTVEVDFTKLQISLVDKDTKENIDGGILHLIDENGEVVLEIDNTGEDFYIERLPIGNYTLVENTTPIGYFTAEDINFTLEDIPEIQYVVMENERKDFNLSINKETTGILINGSAQEITDPKLSKVEVVGSRVNSTNIQITYKITVSNIGELEGTAKVVDNIPEHFEIADTNPDYWTIVDDKTLETNVELDVGETKEFEVVLNWIQGRDTFGGQTNIARLVDTTNPANFEEIDLSDNSSEAEIVMSIKTGIEQIVQWILLGLGIVAIVGSIAGIIVYKVGKKKN